MLFGITTAHADTLLLPVAAYEGDFYRTEVCLGLDGVDTATGAVTRRFRTLGCPVAAAFAGDTRAFVLSQRTAADTETHFDLLHLDLAGGRVLAQTSVAKAATENLQWLRTLSDTEALILLSAGTAAAPQTRLVRAGLVEGRWQLRADLTREGRISMTDSGGLLALWHGGPAGFTVDLVRTDDLGLERSLTLPVSLQARTIGVFAQQGVVHVVDIEGDFFHRSFDAATGLARDAGPWPWGYTPVFPFDASGRLLVTPGRQRFRNGLPIGYEADLVAVDLDDGSAIPLAHFEATSAISDYELGHADDRVALVAIDNFYCFDEPCGPPPPLTYVERRGAQVFPGASERVHARIRSLQFLGPAIAPGSAESGPAPGSIPSLRAAGLALLALALVASAGRALLPDRRHA
jgi:hypothetical protein